MSSEFDISGKAGLFFFPDEETVGVGAIEWIIVDEDQPCPEEDEKFLQQLIDNETVIQIKWPNSVRKKHEAKWLTVSAIVKNSGCKYTTLKLIYIYLHTLAVMIHTCMCAD